MGRRSRECYLCGAKYSYCPTCSQDKMKPAWARKKRGNFVIPLAPLKINIPIFARLSIQVPQIISISGNANLTWATTCA